MSSEGENTKKPSSEVDKKENDANSDPKAADEKDVKVEKESDKGDDKVVVDAKPKEKSPAPDEKADKQNNDLKKETDNEKDDAVDGKKDKDDKTDNDTEEGEGSDKEEGSDTEENSSVPLLDQPLQQAGTRERKKVQRFNEDLPADAKEGKTEIPDGSGTQLGEIPRIDASISRFKNEDLKLLHRLLFKTPGKTTLIKKNIKRFNGFDFDKDSDEYTKKLQGAQKFELKQLKSICEMLDLEKKGNKEEISERVLDFLIEPKDSGKSVGGGRPKRTAAVKANNRGYSSHDDSYSSDERHTPRARRDKGKRVNLKEESSSESDEDFHPSDEEERPRVTKVTAAKRGRKKVQSEDDVSEVEDSPSTEDSDEEPKKRKRGTPAKVVNNKTKGKATPKTRGRKPAAAIKKKTPSKRGRKQDNESSDEEESEHQEQEDGSSSEDEPLAKKKATQPPTDDEIKTYVKEILDGANLEEITMKTVCKQVYAHYPDFDLAHKKDFIKTTVKSLIST